MAEVNADALIEEFDREWLDFLGEDDPSDAAKREFVVDSVYVMGVEHFLAGDWVISTSAYDASDVRVLC